MCIGISVWLREFVSTIPRSSILFDSTAAACGVVFFVDFVCRIATSSFSNVSPLKIVLMLVRAVMDLKVKVYYHV